MIAPPSFSSLQEHKSHIGDVDLWQPHVIEVLQRHQLDTGPEPVAGYNPTYPTFLVGDAVVKFFGYSRAWRRGHASERAAQAVIARDPEISAPRVLAEGQLCDDPDAPWPYLITSRMRGVAMRHAELSDAQRRDLAVDLGRLVRRIHALPTEGAAQHEDWQTDGLAAGAARSSLPPHMVAQVDDFIAGLAPFDRVFTHGDLCAMHAFVEDGRLTGIIDWGDAMVSDRHYELIQIYRDTFRCDSGLFRVFLEAAQWPVGEDFARRALGMAIHRQAVGLAQHHGMDVFQPVAQAFPLDQIATLDELATALFATT